jgi:hypothetical protein
MSSEQYKNAVGAILNEIETATDPEVALAWTKVLRGMGFIEIFNLDGWDDDEDGGDDDPDEGEDAPIRVAS